MSVLCRIVALGLLLAACAPGDRTAQITSEPLVLPTLASPQPVPTLALTPEATVPSLQSLVVWWPEPVAPVGDIQASVILTEQMDGFLAAHPDILLETRLKKPRDVGGIMETLRAASAVAPGALPDVTLLRRDDLLTAVRDGLVQPLEGHVSSAILGNLYTAALELGQVNGQLYGLPYMLEVQHLAYRGDFPSGDYATFENVLALHRPFVFPAGVTSGLSGVFLLQYLSAGGALSDFSTGEINAEALRTALAFYEEALAAGVLDMSLLNYSSYADYRAALVDGSLPAAVVPSTAYLGLTAAGQTLGFAPIPVQAGQPTTILDGWLWVMTTPNSDRQLAAARFLDWMSQSERQSRYSQAIRMLPALRGALRQAGVNAAYGDFVTQLIGSAVLPSAEITSSAAARAIQNALSSVLSGQRTADEATQDTFNQLSG